MDFDIYQIDVTRCRFNPVAIDRADAIYFQLSRHGFSANCFNTLIREKTIPVDEKCYFCRSVFNYLVKHCVYCRFTHTQFLDCPCEDLHTMSTVEREKYIAHWLDILNYIRHQKPYEHTVIT
jgi:hypothetical protein